MIIENEGMLTPAVLDAMRPDADPRLRGVMQDPSVPMTMRHWPHASLDLGAGEQHRGYAQQSFAAERRS